MMEQDSVIFVSDAKWEDNEVEDKDLGSTCEKQRTLPDFLG